MALQYLSDRNGWLSFNHSTPVLYITSEDEEFDVETMRAWRDEGFIVKYVPMGKGGKQYVQTLYKLGDSMGIGERFAIVGILPFLCSRPSILFPRRTSDSHAVYWRLTESTSLWRRSCSLPRCLLRAEDRYIEALLLGRVLPNVHPRYAPPLHRLLSSPRTPGARHGWR